MGKKIIVGCDGTWLNSDDGFRRTSYLPWASETSGTLEVPSNVTRMCRALQPPTSSPDATVSTEPEAPLQIVDYEAGIGSSNSLWDHYVNGATAMSIGENVCAGYRFISANYKQGDEIYLLGFSRGSFVARSIASMIRYLGLLNKNGMEYFFLIFQDWENQNIPGYKRMFYPSSKKFNDETDVDWCGYAMQLKADNLTTLGIRIKAIACYDTVGSLGIPTIGWTKPNRSYAFVNTEVLSNVDNCFHALALDEMRRPFSPTLWELPIDRLTNPKNPGTLRQCWFPGCHSNIGGSVEDAELPNLVLAWMTSQLARFLAFDPEYLRFCVKVNADYYKAAKMPVRGWAMGKMTNPMTGIQVLAGKRARSPGQYYRTDYETGAPEYDQSLQNTFETIHPAVRIRRWNKQQGKGMDDKGSYDPSPMDGFKLIGGNGKEGDPLSGGWSWVMERDPVHGKRIELKEEVLADIEQMLLEFAVKV